MDLYVSVFDSLVVSDVVVRETEQSQRVRSPGIFSWVFDVQKAQTVVFVGNAPNGAAVHVVNASAPATVGAF